MSLHQLCDHFGFEGLLDEAGVAQNWERARLSTAQTKLVADEAWYALQLFRCFDEERRRKHTETQKMMNQTRFGKGKKGTWGGPPRASSTATSGDWGETQRSSSNWGSRGESSTGGYPNRHSSGGGGGEDGGAEYE